MEKRYRLKVEARQFFDDDLHKEIKPLDWWIEKVVAQSLLDEVPRVYITYGFDKVTESGTTYTDLSGWSGPDKAAQFMFTVHLLDVTHREYNNVKAAEVMDEIQKVLNRYFQ